MIESAKRKAYFAGDTGYSPSFPEIGQRFGGPADAIRAHLDVESRFSIACHWGLLVSPMSLSVSHRGYSSRSFFCRESIPTNFERCNPARVWKFDSSANYER